MGLKLDYIDGQTPIDDEEREGLLIETISTRSELDEFEQHNIEGAILWVLGRKFSARQVFDEAFICNVHKRMYGNVWAWAGEFRKTDKNLGIDKFKIPVELKVLCDDALYWFQNGSYPPIETAIRFKHRLVSIHCFPNGNGRHSRLMADIIVEKLYGLQPFSWGFENLTIGGAARAGYLQAVKAADRGDLLPLITFAQS